MRSNLNDFDAKLKQTHQGDERKLFQTYLTAPEWRNVGMAQEYGKFCEIPAGAIDRAYLLDANSLISKMRRILKVNIIYAFYFLVLVAVDTVFSFLGALVLKIASLFMSDDHKRKRFRKLADKYLDMFIKNLMGLIASPIGIFAPKLIPFYFIGKNPNKNQILSGSHLYSMPGKIHTPATIGELKKIIRNANKSGQKVTVIGAGRSQGKQFMPPEEGNIVLQLKHFNEVRVNRRRKTATVGAGAIWGDVQVKANGHQLALKVMQASNVFSIGGSISANIHGWHKAGTLANTIRSLTIIDVNGKVKKLNPKDELFSYVIGGYSQYGVIIEAEIELTDNELLTQKCVDVKPREYFSYFKRNVEKNIDNRMHLYRLSLNPNNLLGEGVAVNYCKDKDTVIQKTPNFHKEPKKGTRLERIILNLARRFQWLRKFYWSYEKNRLLKNEDKLTTNDIMHPPINAMFNHSISEREWLQEYFVPGENLDAFLKELGGVLTKNQVKLLNATVRYVKQDNISKMGYANGGDRFAVVLCFNQRLNNNEVQKAKKWIRQATELALKYNGTYYLPYLPFATKEQFTKAYPTKDACYLKKLSVDPKETFSSGFSMQFMKNEAHQTIINDQESFTQKDHNDPKNKAWLAMHHQHSKRYFRHVAKSSANEAQQDQFTFSSRKIA